MYFVKEAKMLLKTHLAFAMLMILLFISHVDNKLIFFFMVIIATAIPDLDTQSSSWGRHLIFRPLQFFIKHRSLLHSFTFAILISVALAYVMPVLSLGFFVGYSVHIICDSFTKEGVQPFWPLKIKSSGPFRTGGRVEESLFLSLILINIFVFVVFFILN